MKRNYFYLIVGVLCVLFAITHTWNGLGTVLSDLNHSNLDDNARTVFTYIWHMIGAENLVFGIALIVMAFQKNMEKVKAAAWIIASLLLARWGTLTLVTVLNAESNITVLLVDTVAMFTLVTLLVLGTRVKSST